MPDMHILQTSPVPGHEDEGRLTTTLLCSEHIHAGITVAERAGWPWVASYVTVPSTALRCHRCAERDRLERRSYELIAAVREASYGAREDVTRRGESSREEGGDGQ